MKRRHVAKGGETGIPQPKPRKAGCRTADSVRLRPGAAARAARLTRAIGASVATQRQRRSFLSRMAEKRTTYEEPSKVEAVDGAVHVDGPDAVDVALTPEAAGETALRLENEGVRARGQRRLKGVPRPAKD